MLGIVLLLGILLGGLAPGALPVQAVSTTVVISQVYGGAGCPAPDCSTYQNDYIELFNLGTSAQSLNGWSVQYAAATGSFWQRTNLTNVTLLPGQYYLVAEAAGTGGTNSLPSPDTTGTIAMSATTGKVALVNTTTTLTVACPSSSSIVDIVG
jgi:predicted extracellular nuclease